MIAKRFLLLMFLLVASLQCIAQKKRIGFVDKDSLLQLMPGYKECRDSAEQEKRSMDTMIYILDFQIQDLQRELDSTRDELSDRKRIMKEFDIQDIKDLRNSYSTLVLTEIRRKDSIRTDKYVTRLDSALQKVAEIRNCFAYYDRAKAYDYWSAKEAEFVDLNAEVANEMGL